MARARPNAGSQSNARVNWEWFPKELEEIFKLKPLRHLANDDDFITAFGNIVHRNERLTDRETKQKLLKLIQDVDEAADKIELVRKGIEGLDSELIKPVVNIASQLLPAAFPEALRKEDLTDIFFQFQARLLFLSTALGLGTGLIPTRQKRGRKPSEHVSTAIELIQLWEHATAKKSVKNQKHFEIHPAPSPKKDKGLIGQNSTEFVRLAFKLISPGITDAEVFTAIKHALKDQSEFYRLLPKEGDAAKLTGAIFRMNERARLVRKKGLKRTN